LFADVQLRSKPQARALKRCGFQLERRGKSWSLPQPCAAFDGKLCTFYPLRPNRCRVFECRVLQRAGKGEVSRRQALRLIHRARRLLAEIERLLRRLGQRDAQLPLNRRYQALFAQPWDFGATAASLKARSRLWKLGQKLDALLGSEFR
jgi:hypothetical protein